MHLPRFILFPGSLRPGIPERLCQVHSESEAFSMSYITRSPILLIHEPTFSLVFLLSPRQLQKPFFWSLKSCARLNSTWSLAFLTSSWHTQCPCTSPRYILAKCCPVASSQQPFCTFQPTPVCIVCVNTASTSELICLTTEHSGSYFSARCIPLSEPHTFELESLAGGSPTDKKNQQGK